jgi:N-acetylglucosamine-6-phosphate deacetylase
MDAMVRHFKKVTTATLPEIIRMASLTPAERTGIASRFGSIEIGKQADLLLMSKSLEIEQVFVAGRKLGN